MGTPRSVIILVNIIATHSRDNPLCVKYGDLSYVALYRHMRDVDVAQENIIANITFRNPWRMNYLLHAPPRVAARPLLEGKPVSVGERLDYVLGMPHQTQPRENEIDRRMMMLIRAATHRIFSVHE